MQLRRDLARVPILVRHPGRLTWRAVAPQPVPVEIEKIKVAPRLTRITRRRLSQWTTALLDCTLISRE